MGKKAATPAAPDSRGNRARTRLHRTQFRRRRGRVPRHGRHAGGHPAAGPRPGDAQHRLLQRQVSGDGALNQAVELRRAEGLPPARVGRGGGRLRFYPAIRFPVDRDTGIQSTLHRIPLEGHRIENRTTYWWGLTVFSLLYKTRS